MRVIRLFLLVALTVVARNARAVIHSLPPTVATEALSETVPMPSPFYPTTDIGIEDFSVDWIGAPIEGARARFGEQSVEWVRVANVLVVPRARLLIEIDGAEGGLASNAGFHQPIVAENGRGTIELPIALLSDERNSIDLVVRRSGKELKGRLRVRFRPRMEASEPRVLIDASCSPYKVAIDEATLRKRTGPWKSGWIYIGCRFVYVEGDRNTTSSLEFFVFWNDVGQAIEIDGVSKTTESVAVWPLRLRARPGRVQLRAPGGDSVELTYRIPERVRYAFLGAGIGPYVYALETPGDDVRATTAVVTLYGSVFLNELIRLVVFNATPVHKTTFSDTGLYLYSEYFRTFDLRLSLNFLLGGNFRIVRANGNTELILGAPQGAEILYRDMFRRWHNATLGAFIYPLISGKSYYNVWLRWGSGALFAELNYIAWHETLGTGRFYSRSAGITVGLPLARFF